MGGLLATALVLVPVRAMIAVLVTESEGDAFFTIGPHELWIRRHSVHGAGGGGSGGETR